MTYECSIYGVTLVYIQTQVWTSNVLFCLVKSRVCMSWRTRPCKIFRVMLRLMQNYELIKQCENYKKSLTRLLYKYIKPILQKYERFMFHKFFFVLPSSEVMWFSNLIIDSRSRIRLFYWLMWTALTSISTLWMAIWGLCFLTEKV